MVDARDLKSLGPQGRAGSSPAAGTISDRARAFANGTIWSLKFNAIDVNYLLSIDLGSACRSALPSFGPIQLQSLTRGASALRPIAMERTDVHRYSEMVQFDERVRLHSAGRRLQGCLRSYFRGRARGHWQSARGPKGFLRCRARPAGKDVGGQSQ